MFLYDIELIFISEVAIHSIQERMRETETKSEELNNNRRSNIWVINTYEATGDICTQDPQ